MKFISLFAGIGGIDLGLERAGMKCVAQVEIDPFCRRVLAKHWPDVPKFDDVRTFNRDSIQGEVDLIAGGFPCQDISNAGKKAGIDGERSGLWSEYYRIICAFRPRFVLVENVAALLVRGIDRVLGDLAAVGFDAEWSVLSACAVGAPHLRERLFVLAYSNQIGRERIGENFEETRQGWWRSGELERLLESESRMGIPAGSRGRICDGLPDRVDRLGALGNAVVPQVAQWIGERLMIADKAVSHVA